MVPSSDCCDMPGVWGGRASFVVCGVKRHCYRLVGSLDQMRADKHQYVVYYDLTARVTVISEKRKENLLGHG